MQVGHAVQCFEVHQKGLNHHGKKGQDAGKLKEYTIQHQTRESHRFALCFRDQALHRVWARVLSQRKSLLLSSESQKPERRTG